MGAVVCNGCCVSGTAEPVPPATPEDNGAPPRTRRLVAFDKASLAYTKSKLSVTFEVPQEAEDVDAYTSAASEAASPSKRPALAVTANRSHSGFVSFMQTCKEGRRIVILRATMQGDQVSLHRTEARLTLCGTLRDITFAVSGKPPVWRPLNSIQDIYTVDDGPTAIPASLVQGLSTGEAQAVLRIVFGAENRPSVSPGNTPRSGTTSASGLESKASSYSSSSGTVGRSVYVLEESREHRIWLMEALKAYCASAARCVETESGEV